ncbi:uncharacterized protein EI90DRAFT_3053576 [Cantharellus anzutake]|uniref:uncharacterized protein n=1 Tax=Cantharellus anzutake TaxID=1750568 RepID=UPI001906F840|nr:uncharacterized protein EI90DRAFT_3053576 [Cantharellus anzutake]KAF8333248.1 hypothetical protein EI90DRAFT_3053576 [Cantharellus anzutake]
MVSHHEAIMNARKMWTVSFLMILSLSISGYLDVSRYQHAYVRSHAPVWNKCLFEIAPARLLSCAANGAFLQVVSACPPLITRGILSGPTTLIPEPSLPACRVLCYPVFLQRQWDSAGAHHCKLGACPFVWLMTRLDHSFHPSGDLRVHFRLPVCVALASSLS